MRLWVTRTRPGAETTAERLREAGHEAVVEPVLTFAALPRVVADLSGVTALAFSSAHAVSTFVALTPRRDLPVFVTGEATAATARNAGFVTVQAADGGLPELAALIKSAGIAGAVLWPCATEPAGDLATLVGERPAVRALPVYETVEAPWTTPADVDGVLVASPKAARLIAARLTPDDARRIALYAISPAAAAALATLPFAGVFTAPRPSETAMLALIRP